MLGLMVMQCIDKVIKIDIMGGIIRDHKIVNPRTCTKEKSRQVFAIENQNRNKCINTHLLPLTKKSRFLLEKAMAPTAPI